jgi:hypothetical protein
MQKRLSAEQIVGLLRQADVDLGEGSSVPEACPRLGSSQQTYYQLLPKGLPSPRAAMFFWCRRRVSPSPASWRLRSSLASGVAQRLWMSWEAG